MSNTNTSSKTRSDRPVEPEPVTEKTDWAKVDAMSDDEVVARALTDPHNPPRSTEELRRMKTRPRVFTIRRAFKMSQEEFAEAFRIPLQTIRDWEDSKSEPTPVERAYLKVIAVDRAFVEKALGFVPGQDAAE